MNMKPNIFLLAFFLIGCGTIKETTTTTTLPVTIPPVVIHDTVKSYIAWERTGYAFVNLDSLKEWTLINLCKGEKTIDTAGIKETISYSYKRTIRTLADSLKNLTRVVGILKIDLDKKEQIIQGTKTISQKESTPGDWGIFFASIKFWFPALILGIIIGAIGLIILKMKTTLLTKFL